MLTVDQTVELVALVACMTDFIRQHPCGTPKHLVQCLSMIDTGSATVEIMEERGKEFFGKDVWEAAVKAWQERVEKYPTQVHIIRIGGDDQAPPLPKDPNKLN